MKKEIVIAISTGIIGVGSLALLAIPVKETIKVDYVGWKYSVEVEEFKTLEETGWTVPEGGRVKKSEKRFYKNEEINMGKDSNGKEMKVTRPVYKTYYTYDIDKWVYKTTLYTTANDRNPHYDVTYKLAENERFGKKSESYYILNNGEEWECNKAIWDCAELGGTIEIKHFRFGKTILKMEVK